MENGAMRNFECIRLAEKQAEAEAKQAKEEEENNPMKILENRTRDSRREMAVLETLEDLREMNAANLTVDPKILFEEEETLRQAIEQQEKDEDEAEIRRIFGKKGAPKNGVFEIIVEDFDEREDEEELTEPVETNCAVKHKLEPVANDSVKKARVETVEEKTQVPNGSVLFPKVSLVPKEPVASQPVVGQLNKNTVTSFIKKKPLVVKSEPVIPSFNKNNNNINSLAADPTVIIKPEKTEPTNVGASSGNAAAKPVASLASLLNAYDDSDASSGDSDIN